MVENTATDECEHDELPWTLVDEFDDDDLGEFPLGEAGIVKRGVCPTCGDVVRLTHDEPPPPRFLLDEEQVAELQALSPEELTQVHVIAQTVREQAIEAYKMQHGI